jgi:ParB family chromosome partitioning protein
MGVGRAPVFLLDRPSSAYDEVRFNQLHNGTDLDSGDEACTIAGGFDRLGFVVVEPAKITGNMRSRLAAVRSEIADLVTVYGPWGACVATQPAPTREVAPTPPF